VVVMMMMMMTTTTTTIMMMMMIVICSLFYWRRCFSFMFSVIVNNEFTNIWEVKIDVCFAVNFHNFPEGALKNIYRGDVSWWTDLHVRVGHEVYSVHGASKSLLSDVRISFTLHVNRRSSLNTNHNSAEFYYCFAFSVRNLSVKFCRPKGQSTFIFSD
jgi:hypothetical protein